MTSPLRKVLATISDDGMIRVELLECGHRKALVTGLAGHRGSRPALRRRCYQPECNPPSPPPH